MAGSDHRSNDALADAAEEEDVASINLASMARLDTLTRAIGEDYYGRALLDTVRSIGAVEHITIFSFAPRCAPRVVISTGSIDPATATATAERYQAGLYLLDPNYQEVRQQHESCDVLWYDFDRQGGVSDAFDEGFLQPAAITDMLCFSICQDRIIYYVMLLRLNGKEFAPAERWLLHQIGEVVAANVGKHFSYMHMVKGENQFMIGRILSEAPGFRDVTGRERAVCVGILTGHTSESIALNLVISINSVLTYRKRLYEKLGITSQNELFAKVIGAMMQVGDDNAENKDGQSMLIPRMNGQTGTAKAIRSGVTAAQDGALAVAFPA